MKKHNGNGHAHGQVRSKGGGKTSGELHQSVSGEQIPVALAQVEHVFEHGHATPVPGHLSRPWENALSGTQVGRAVRADARAQLTEPEHGTYARGWRPVAQRAATLPRILLQPTIPQAVPIGPGDEQGIGIHVREGGVMVKVEAWSPMQIGDLLELFWGAPDDPQSPGYPGTPVASKTLLFADELNKSVLLSVPQSDVVAGWFNVVCRVTRANNGYQELSPLLRVLVKLDRPGGIDPAPDENPNLAAPILPPKVISGGVDASWASRGVPVTILPYPNMAIGDRIRLNWGGAFVEYTLRSSSEVDQPVTLTVDGATIRAAGDSDALVLRYQVYDLVNNRSGWSPSTSVAVDVHGNALFLPEVTDADDNGVIDLAQLGDADVRVLVTAFAPDFAVGDTVTLQWTGHTAEGMAVPYEETQPVTRTPVQTLEFFVPNASVVALAGGDAVVSYSLQTGRSSKQVRVTITGAVAALPAPSVDEALNGELDATLSRATVRIAPYPGMNAGDVVTLIWSGVRADGETHLYQIERQISGSAVGKEVVLSVPGSEIALLAGGTVQLWYEVTLGDGTPLRPSQALMLRVSEAQAVFLPAPTVDEAPDNMTLDPDAVDLYAEVRILPYPNMAIGDRVDMYWVGSGAGGNFNDWITIRAATINKPVLFDVDKAFVTANDGGTVTIRYTVTPQGANPRSSLPRTLRVGAAQEVVPAIVSVRDANGEIPDGGSTPDTTVTLSGTAAIDQAIELFDDTTSLGIIDVDGDGVWMRTVTSLADGNHRFTVKALYGSEPVSPAWSFTVAALVGLAAPVVTEADPYTDTLNLVKPVNGVHVVVDYAGMAIGDVVTMIWKGTDGSGTQYQAVEVETLGPIPFTVDKPAISPNVNRTVRVLYTVRRAGTPGIPAVESSALELSIIDDQLWDQSSFHSGTTSFFRCAARTSITIPDDLPVGEVIETTASIGPSAYTGVLVGTDPSHYRINLAGSQPGRSSVLFATRFPGIAFRVLYNGAPQISGPAGGPKGGVFNNAGANGQIQFVKTGPIASGAVLQAGVLAQWQVGATRVYYMGWQLMNDITINVVRRSSTHGKRRTSMAPTEV